VAAPLVARCAGGSGRRAGKLAPKLRALIRDPTAAAARLGQPSPPSSRPTRVRSGCQFSLLRYGTHRLAFAIETRLPFLDYRLSSSRSPCPTTSVSTTS
jgi:hypothetical protein